MAGQTTKGKTMITVVITTFEKTMKKFYNYNQNNSGGYFKEDKDRGIGKNVWIEADDVIQANAIAESIGLYWDGVDIGEDCSCCGDRWTKLNENDKGQDEPDKEGYYSEDAYIHYADKRIEKVG